MKYLLIDGNNLAVRAAFANEHLSATDGTPTGAHFGVFQSIVSLRKKFPDYQFLMVWDSHSTRRLEESKLGVQAKVVPELYKENRKKDELPKPLKDFYSQHDFIKRGIGTTGIPQIKVEGFEADDVIASYCNLLKKDNDVVVVTSDQDYFQILDSSVKIFDGMKMLEIDMDWLQKEMGLTPQQFVDYGAICGDAGDNIFGVPSVGDKTAKKELSVHKKWENVVDFYKNKFKSLRDKYPDLSKIDGGESKFKELAEAKTEKGNLKWKDIYFEMPYTGIAYAFEKGEIKISKSELLIVMFEERIKLAYSLKKMDDDIQNLPEIAACNPDKEKLIQYLEFFEMHSLIGQADVLCGNA